MNIAANPNMSWEERLPMQLRSLYRSYGYQIYKMSDFETYDLYRENKNFLSDNNVLTFTDIDGRLMALKPDVTISIAKDTKPEELTRKLFYSEHVFRRIPGNNQFTEIKQMGLEYIGADTGYAEAEVISLACQSLAGINKEYFLGVSHMGYISALMAALAIDDTVQENLLQAIRRKSAGDISIALQDIRLDERQNNAIYSLINLPPALDDALTQMKAAALNDDMLQAISELEAVFSACEVWGLKPRLRMELSLLNDLEYYNGIVFQGYIKGLPRAVLSGGRYDKLLQRFGKSQPALGFALYLNDIWGAFVQPKDYDIDTLLLYGDESPAQVAVAVQQVVSAGQSVLAAKSIPTDISARQVVQLAEILDTKEKDKC